MFSLLLASITWTLGVVVGANCFYLLGLTLLSLHPPASRRSSGRTKFAVIVPAHNEAQVITRTIKSLLELDWPRQCFEVLVVADNCSDDTAALARAAGAEVLQREDATLRGKGYALAHAFAFVLEQRPQFEAVLVVDADSVVSSNMLDACAAQLEAGAEAVQVHYGVLNPFDSWRSRLMTIAMAAFHQVRSMARSRLGVSCGIRGNGWCLRRDVLVRVPYRAYSLAEDVEYGIELGLHSICVRYAGEATVFGEMVSDENSASSQRQRWERGRFDLIRAKSLPLLSAALRQRSLVCFDLALDLLVLPLSYVVLMATALFTLALLLSYLQSSISSLVWVALGCGAMLVVYVMRGWWLSGVGLRALLDFVHVPWFILWKVLLIVRGRRPQSWIRTDRGR